jgi:hypothetical protein
MNFDWTKQCDPSHSACKARIIKLLEYLSTDPQIKVTHDLFLKYINFIAKPISKYDYATYKNITTCCLNHISTHKEILLIMLEYVDITKTDCAIFTKVCEPWLIEMIMNIKKTIPEFLINSLIIDKNKSCVEYIVKKKYTAINSEQLTSIIANEWYEVAEEILTSGHVVPTTESLVAVLTSISKPNTDYYSRYSKRQKTDTDKLDGLIQLLLTMGAPLDKKCLELACCISNDYIIRLCLDSNIKPDQKCFSGLLKSYYNTIKKHDYISYKSIIPKSSDLKKTNELIKLIVDAGYKITEKDILATVENKFTLDNFDSYGIKLDKKYLDKCVEFGFYPYDNAMAPDISCLEKECDKSGNLNNIKRMIKEKKIVPNLTCLRNASKHSNNLAVIKYLVSEHNLKPDFDCLRNQIDVLSNSTLGYLLREYELVAPDGLIKEKLDIVDLSHIDISKESKQRKVIKLNNNLSEFIEDYKTKHQNYLPKNIKNDVPTFKDISLVIQRYIDDLQDDYAGGVLDDKHFNRNIIKINTVLENISGLKAGRYLRVDSIKQFTSLCIHYGEKKEEVEEEKVEVKSKKQKLKSKVVRNKKKLDKDEELEQEVAAELEAEFDVDEEITVAAT